MTTPALLEARDLACSRGERELFSGLTIELRPREVVHIEGLNGSGKTTLLRVLCGLTLASAGEIYWHGEPIAKCRHDYAQQMLFVGHASGVKLELSALENLRFTCALRAPVGDDAIEDALIRLGLGAAVDIPCRSLSAGQRRRVALARLILIPATLWILDEPLTALDTSGIELLHALIREHCDGGGAVVLASHQSLEASMPNVRSVALEDAR